MKFPNWKILYTGVQAPPALPEARFTPLLAAILEARGITSPEDTRKFLFGKEELLEDPLLLKDIHLAVDRIEKAVQKGEKVAVYGDYDVDGITAACMMTDYLQSRGLDCLLYIPDRIEEGYGLNTAAIKSLGERGVSLIITVDCGVTAIAETEHASSLGIDMIITDHHECREALPAAKAVINPKRPDCPYPNPSLAGVGVVFKLLCAVERDSAHILERYGDLVAVGTIADVMPLTGENRYITWTGLEKLNRNPRPGIAALLRESGLADRRLNATSVGFSVAPKLNAAGRLGQVEIATRLLLTENRKEAEKLARRLCELNRSRQAMELDIWKQAEAMMGGASPDTPIVLASEDWHQGVVGIAASRLTEVFSVPAVMICFDGDMGKGSCRSYGTFNFFEALSACSEHLESFGGHALAAGLNIRRDKVDDFRSALEKYYLQTPPEYAPQLELDLRIESPKLLSMECVESLELLEPCGHGNPKPQLCIMDALLKSVMPIGDRHLRLYISKFNQSYECVFFSCREEELGLKAGDRIDVAFSPQINEFRGRRTVQLHIIDIKPHDPLPLCRRVLAGMEGISPLEGDGLSPTRREFAKIWRRLEAAGGSLSEDLEETLYALRPKDMPLERACVCLAVFKELGLLKLELNGDNISMEQISTNGKKKLSESGILQKLSGK
ncbi:MAG TPA: single-stranded-DNA-specific exonuclease RecJ [Clostridiales bacterium]|nr:single-stranded-DNA-specific exonuclease RecJ [Clostridiales bacterium]